MKTVALKEIVVTRDIAAKWAWLDRVNRDDGIDVLINSRMAGAHGDPSGGPRSGPRIAIRSHMPIGSG